MQMLVLYRFSQRVYLFLFLLLVGGALLSQSHAKEVVVIEEGHINLVFYGPEDKIAYDFVLEEWPTQAKAGVIESFLILHHAFDLKSTMTIGVMWSKDVANYHSIALSYKDFVTVPDINVGGVDHLDKNYKYPKELLNQLMDNDHYAGENITILYNSLINWCYTRDRLPTDSQQDLITVTLHELVHGLGMSTSFTKTNHPIPYIMDKYIVDANNRHILDQEHYSAERERTMALTSDQIYFAGPNAMTANDGVPVQLFAPSNLTSASLCHVDTKYQDNQCANLMVPGTGYGQNTRYLGSYVLGILKDVGWPIKEGAEGSTANEKISDINDNEHIRVFTDNGIIHIESYQEETIEVHIYSLTGALLYHGKQSSYGQYTMEANTIYIVKINNRTYKIKA